MGRKLNSRSAIGKDTKVGMLSIFAGVLCYRILLEKIYAADICATYGYMGFSAEKQGWLYLLSWAACIGIVPILKWLYSKDSISNCIIGVLCLVSYIPATVIMGLTEMKYAGLWMAYWLVLFIAQALLPEIPIKRENQITRSELFVNVLSFALLGTVIFIWAYYARFRIYWNILNVYGIRREAKSYAMSSLMRYTYSTAKIVFPTLLVYMLARKRRLMAVLCCIGQCVAFFIDGSKMTLFSLAFSLAAYWYMNKHEVIPQKSLLWGSLAICLLARLERILLNSIYITGVFIRRVLFLPVRMTTQYYNFFSGNEKDVFRQGLLGRFGFESPYSMPIQRIVGGLQGSTEQWANCGLFADAYANLGAWSIVIMPVLIVFAIRLLEVSAKGLHKKITIACLITESMAFVNNSYFVILLTHGLLLLCLTFFCMPRMEDTGLIDR